MLTSMTDRQALRRRLVAARESMPDRLERAVALQSVLRVWLVGRTEQSIGGYQPIKGEFDPLPALFRWSEAAEAPEARIVSATRIAAMRRIGLPVVGKASGEMRFRIWYPGCPMEPDAFGIPKPRGTEEFMPEMVLVPCLGYGPGGVRLGYGGGFFDRALRSLRPRPYTVGLCYGHGFLPLLRPEAEELPLDAVLTDEGVSWQRP
jgi:5-formyltetrahydrofolate cyclo-ligase